MEMYRIRTGKRTALAALQVTNGILLTLLCVAAFFSMKLWTYFVQDVSLFSWSALVLFLTINLYMFYLAAINLATVRRSRQIVRVLTGGRPVAIEQLAEKTGRSKSGLLRDISRMARQGYFQSVCVLQDCVVLENPDFPKALMIGAGKQRYFTEESRLVFGGVAIRERKTKALTPEGKQQTEKSRVEKKAVTPAEERILAGKKHLQELQKWNNTLKNPDMRHCVEEICAATEQMLNFTAENPEKSVLIRQTVEYDLPTISGLLCKYEALAGQTIKGDTIQTSLKKIEDGMAVAAENLKLELDNLYMEESIHIAVDIEVMENLMKEKRRLLWKEAQQ